MTVFCAIGRMKKYFWVWPSLFCDFCRYLWEGLISRWRSCQSFHRQTPMRTTRITSILLLREADMSNVFQDIKDRVDLKELVRYYGLDVNCLSCARLAVLPAARFTTRERPALRSMKTISIVSGAVLTEITSTLYKSCSEERTSKQQSVSVTTSGLTSLIRNLPLLSSRGSNKRTSWICGCSRR